MPANVFFTIFLLVAVLLPVFLRAISVGHCLQRFASVFSALTLKGEKASEVWDPEAKGADDYQGGHKLIIKQAVLGADATQGEVNVLQVNRCSALAVTFKTKKACFLA